MLMRHLMQYIVVEHVVIALLREQADRRNSVCVRLSDKIWLQEFVLCPYQLDDKPPAIDISYLLENPTKP
jgi:hypothetical protein